MEELRHDNEGNRKKQYKNLVPRFSGAVEVILTMLLNKNDELRYEISNWKEKYQKLSDELNKLKGEQGRPSIKPQTKDNEGDDEEKEVLREVQEAEEKIRRRRK